VLGITPHPVLNMFEYSSGYLELGKEFVFRSKSKSGNTNSGMAIDKGYFPFLGLRSETLKFLVVNSRSDITVVTQAARLSDSFRWLGVHLFGKILTHLRKIYESQ
jgi:hypothetical protein